MDNRGKVPATLFFVVLKVTGLPRNVILPQTASSQWAHLTLSSVGYRAENLKYSALEGGEVSPAELTAPP